MADNETTVTIEDGTQLTPVPFASQDYDDLMSSLEQAIAQRKLLMGPFEEFMHGDEVAAVIDYLEANADKFQNEPLVTVHYNAALGCLMRLRDASRS